MGKFTKVASSDEAWSTEEAKSLDAAKAVVLMIEKHESFLRGSKEDLKLCSRLKDLKIRWDIIKEYNPSDDIFPANVNSHIRESLQCEIAQKESKVGEILENLNQSLKCVEEAVNAVEMSLQNIVVTENPSHQRQELMRFLSYILDTSLSILAYYTKLQTDIELLTITNFAALGNFEGVEKNSKNFAQFVNEFLSRCHMETLLK